MGVIIFDGTCVFCNRFATFVARRDRAKAFRFGASQARVAEGLLRRHALEGQVTRTIVFIDDNDRAHLYSGAVLAIVSRLSWPWPLARVFVVVPVPVRDGLYRMVAAIRHRVAGKQACAVPSPEVRERLL